MISSHPPSLPAFQSEVRAAFWRGLTLLLIAWLAGRDSLVDTSTPARARRLIVDREFDFVEWTLDAAAVKLAQGALGDQAFLTDEQRKLIVLDYGLLVDQIQQAEGRIRQLYTDPNVADPHGEAAPVLAKLAGLRARQAQRQPLAEAILQNQVTSALAGLGIITAGQAVPPVSFHETPLPLALIVSPRDVIRQDANLDIQPGLTADEQAALEDHIDRALSASSLIVPLGGIGVYPTMIEETSSLNWLAEVVAHEWIHNFLSLRPLGLRYLAGGQLQTMNETTAIIAGEEIGEAVIARYYPELVPPPLPPAGEREPQPAPAPAGPPPFDFSAEMHATRVNVDRLLSEGKVDEAEAYMELRRQVFWENGYQIRKLNQAYFAFYASYADRPGAAGADPVGPAVVELRRRSPSLDAFLKRISWMTSFEQLQRALERGG